jgi:hypothetical protein
MVTTSKLYCRKQPFKQKCKHQENKAVNTTTTTPTQKKQNKFLHKSTTLKIKIKQNKNNKKL